MPTNAAVDFSAPANAINRTLNTGNGYAANQAVANALKNVTNNVPSYAEDTGVATKNVSHRVADAASSVTSKVSTAVQRVVPKSLFIHQP